MTYSDDDLIAMIYAAIEQHVFPKPTIDFNLDTPLAEIGLSDSDLEHDSRSFLNLAETMIDIEINLKIFVDDEEYFAFKTLRDILNAIKKQLANSESKKESEQN